MRKTITILILTIGMIGRVTGQVEVTNKYLLATGITTFEWNKAYFSKDISYFARVNDDNYKILIEAERVLSMYGKEFGDYDLDESTSDGEIDPIDVVYEKVPFRSSAKVLRIYYLSDKVTMRVCITETISMITLYRL